MSNSVRAHRRQPTRLPCPWDSPGKNTGVGYHCLLQCMKGKREGEVVAQSCLTPRDPMDCSPPGSSVRGIFQARALEWGASAFSTGHTYTHKHTCMHRCTHTMPCVKLDGLNRPSVTHPWTSNLTTSKTTMLFLEIKCIYFRYSLKNRPVFS